MSKHRQVLASKALLPTGWADHVRIVVGDDGVISDVSVGVSPEPDDFDRGSQIVLPAPTNVHSHTFQRAMAGRTETRGPDPRDSFWTWRQTMYAFVDELTPEQIEAIAALAFMEMLEAGFSSVVEFHYLHHQKGGQPYDDLGELSDRIISAAGQTGIGLTHVPVLYQQAGCDGRALSDGQLRFRNSTDSFSKLHECCRGAMRQMGRPDDVLGISAHSLRAVDAAGLAHVVQLADRGPIHLHVAEQQAEVDEVLAHSGRRPVEWLLDQHDIDGQWCLIHCTHMTELETQALATSKAIAGLCPVTESNLGDGIFNGDRFLPRGGRIGVGSDSNIAISFFDELRTLEYSQRLRDQRRASLATRDRSVGRYLFDAALEGGAAAAARQSGAILEGYFADLVALKADNHWLDEAKGDEILDRIIFTAVPRSLIRDVWSAGRHVVVDGVHVQREQIIANYRSSLRRLRLSVGV